MRESPLLFASSILYLAALSPRLLCTETRAALHFQIKGTAEYLWCINTNCKIPAVRVVGAFRNTASALVGRKEIGEQGILER